MQDFWLNLFAAVVDCSVDSPNNPWRERIIKRVIDPFTGATQSDCLDRCCTAHTSCVRREAIIEYMCFYRDEVEKRELAR